MSLTVKVLLNKVRKKNDNSYPLVIRVTYNRKIIYLPLGYTLMEKDFDAKNQRIKSSAKSLGNITRLNNEVTGLVNQVYNTITELEKDNKIQGMSMREIKEEILGPKISKAWTVFSFYEKLILDLKETGKFGNALVYKDSLNAWKKYQNEKDISFDQLTFKTLKSFENFFLSRDVKPNTISVYLRTFRAVYNRAVKEGIISKENYPFDNYQIPSNKTKKRAVTLDVITRIEEHSPEMHTALWDARNFFLFSFYCRGINFVDMAYLKMDNISNGRLHYTRRKTDTPFSIKIHPKAANIIDHYSPGKGGSDYLFPIVQKPNQNEERIYSQVKYKLQNYNKLLKKISRDLGLDITLSTYTARHSYATGLYTKGVSSEVIKESLGHTSVMVTEIYLKSFEDNIVDEADLLLYS